MLAPPEMIMSVFRSQRNRKPSSSRYPTSPTVKNLPIRFFSVFFLSLWYSKPAGGHRHVDGADLVRRQLDPVVVEDGDL